jgi:type VI protein secretion system component Hcp
MSASEKVPDRAYVKVPDVEGRSTEISHLKWIETLSWSWGVGQFGDPPAAKRNEFTFTMEWEPATQKLIHLAQSGQRVADVRVDLTRQMGKAQRIVVRMVFGEVRVITVGSGSPVPVLMSYEKVQAEHA